MHWRPDGARRVRIPLRNFGNSVYPALPVSFGGDTKSRRSLLSGVYARESKRSHQSALECVTVVDSTTHSKKNSPPPECDYEAENAALHLYGKKKKEKASMNVKRKVHNEYVLPVMVSGSETWALKKAHMELLSVAQRKMERIMLGITLRDHKRNTWIRHQTGVNDIIDVIKKGIHGWAGHIARFKDNRWTKRVTEWTPREWKRRQGRPKTRWRDSLIRHLGPVWPRIVRDHCLWRQFREGFLLTE